MPEYQAPTPDEFAEAAQRKKWLAHMVYDDAAYPFRVNLHTHGLWENFGHLDLQFCVRIPPELFAALINQMVHAIIEHRHVYAVGERSDDVLEGYDVEFIAARECGRDVLRVCLPDKQGRFRSGHLAQQYEQTYVDEAH